MYREPKDFPSNDIKYFDVLSQKPESVFSLKRKNLYICDNCGWWRSNANFILYPPKQYSPRSLTDYCPAIEEIDISKSSVTVDDLIFHLTRKWEDRNLISAGSAESLVASLLQRAFKL